MEKNINKHLDSFLSSNRLKKTKISNTEEEVCDIQSGECYTIRTKDGIIERLNKKYVVEDGRELLVD